MSVPEESAAAAPAGGGWRPKPGRRIWWVAAGISVGVLVPASLLLPGWRHHRVVARIQANLPARPVVPALSSTVAEQVAKAELRARTPATALEGVAELGRLYHANGYQHEAELCWQMLRGAEPRNARWCYYLADLYRTASDYAGMAEFLAQTVRLAPDYAPALLRMADLQLKTGQLAEAARNYEKRLILLPGDPYANLGLVRIALQQGRRDQARELAERLVKATPEFPPGHNLYAEILSAQGEKDAAARQRWLGRETGRFREAEDPWLEELIAWCFNYEQLCIRGTMDFQSKHGDRGKSSFERAIRLQPDTLTAYELLGSLYLELKDAERARGVFEEGLKKATQAKPAAPFFVYLSRAYREMKQPAEAVRVAKEGLSQAGEEFELYDALGVALGDLGENEAAVEALRSAVARNPSDTSANCNLAIALIKVGRLDEAVKALHRSLALRPTFPTSLALLAQIEIDSGRWESAEQYLRPLYESHPEMPQARQMMIYWHLRGGAEAEKKHERAAAEQHYLAGLAIDQNHAELQARLGSLYLVDNRFAEAVKPLEAFHRLQPENPRSCFFLGQAYAALGQHDEARRILTEGARLAEKAGNTAIAQYCREILRHLP